MPDTTNPPQPTPPPPTPPQPAPKTSEEFLNPKSMLTPGIAGGIVMLISQALCNAFHLHLAGTIIALSFLVGLLVFITTSIPIWQRIVYYVLNSLIIFAVAVGASAAASKVGEDPKEMEVEENLAKATEQLAMVESSELELKEILDTVIAENDFIEVEQAADTLAELEHQSDAARQAVKKSVNSVTKDPKKMFKKVF